MDLTPLAALRALESLDVHSTRIRSLAPLGGHPRLAKIDVAWCDQLASLEPLAQCPRIEEIDAVHCDGLEGPKTLRQLGGAPAYDVRNHIPVAPPHAWTVAERMLRDLTDMCSLEVSPDGKFETAV